MKIYSEKFTKFPQAPRRRQPSRQKRFLPPDRFAASSPFFLRFSAFCFFADFCIFFHFIFRADAGGVPDGNCFLPCVFEQFFSSAFPFARRIPGRFHQSARSRARRFFARFPLLTFRSDVRPGTPRESFFPRSENFCDKFCVKGLKNTLKNVIIETDYVIFARLREKFPFFRGNRAFT